MVVVGGRIKYVPRPGYVAPALPPAVAPSVPLFPDSTKIREKTPKVKVDPKLVAAARELRDRWLEHVNAGGMRIEGARKYDVVRAIATTPASKQLRFAA